MMQASFEGKSVWKAGALSLLSSAASYGIGELFKGAAATFGNELLRAGAHGLASGVVSALDGGNFASAFVSGAAASGIGSYAQSVNMNSGLMVASTTVMGSVVAWATGGDFLQGAMQGMMIGALNHAQHDGDEIKYRHDELGNIEGEIPEIVCHGGRKQAFNIVVAVTFLNQHALPYYIKGACGHCAKAVRLALQAGGINTTIHPVSAKEYGAYLKKWGFLEQSKLDYFPMMGDIREFQNYTGVSVQGHIDMYNGAKWVSDYIEKTDWPNPQYKRDDNFKIFRW